MAAPEPPVVEPPVAWVADEGEMAVHEKVTLLAYSPLAAGLLSGKYKGGTVIPEGSRMSRVADLGGRATPRAYAAIEAYHAVAARHEDVITTGRQFLELFPKHALVNRARDHLATSFIIERDDLRDQQPLPRHPAVFQHRLHALVDEALVRRVTRLVDIAEYKRRQSPPGVRVSRKAFGKDRRLPITNHYRP